MNDKSWLWTAINALEDHYDLHMIIVIEMIQGLLAWGKGMWGALEGLQRAKDKLLGLAPSLRSQGSQIQRRESMGTTTANKSGNAKPTEATRWRLYPDPIASLPRYMDV